MMQVQFDNGYPIIGETRAALPNNHERDLFMYRLVGRLSCYVDMETLMTCVKGAAEGPRIVEEKAS
jgi:hypothetical protein